MAFASLIMAYYYDYVIHFHGELSFFNPMESWGHVEELTIPPTDMTIYGIEPSCCK